MSTMPELTEAPVMRLTANDRCDRCGAQAYVVTRHGDTNLLWCAHHFRENEPALAPFVVLNETSELLSTPSH